MFVASKIGESELEIIKILWDKNPLSANEIYEELSSKKSWSKSTVITMANRLVEKGALKSEKRGVITYSPVISEKDYTEYHVSRFVDKIFGGSTKNMLAYFCKSEEITSHDLDELKVMLEGKGEGTC